MIMFNLMKMGSASLFYTGGASLFLTAGSLVAIGELAGGPTGSLPIEQPLKVVERNVFSSFAEKGRDAAIAGYIDAGHGVIPYQMGDGEALERRWIMPVYADADRGDARRPIYYLNTLEGRPSPAEFSAMRRGEVDGMHRVEALGRAYRLGDEGEALFALLRRHGFPADRASVFVEPHLAPVETGG